MATIENVACTTPEEFRVHIQSMADEVLIAQDLVQQGAINAIGFILQHGCTEETAANMLASLRENGKLIREEARGKMRELGIVA